MKLIRRFVKECLNEKKYSPEPEQDVPHGFSFTEMRQHLSRHFGKAKITLTNSPLDLNRDYGPSARLKPSGLWYGCGTEWLSFVEENNWQDEKGSQIWFLKIDMSRVKVLNDPKEINRFSRNYRDIARYIKDPQNKRIDWKKVRADFSGIECCPFPVGDSNFKFEHNWYYQIDISSGCIWDTSAITNSDLVAELKEDGWEVYV